MISKKFVSLYFSSNEIRIIQLASRKKIKVSVSVLIPEGVMTGRSVSDEKTLASLIANIWKKQKIREKSVGIVIPEFSTFTKTLDIPKVERSELDEAVRWQAIDFLPWDSKNTILDWKIIDEQKERYQTLFVAVRKKILLGYINAISSAGLFPVVVETPSLSLVRVSASGNVGKLLFYGGKHSGIFIIAKGEKILGSSIVYSQDSKDFLVTAKRMVNHFKEIKVESVEVGGPGITKEFATELSKVSGKPPALLGMDLPKVSKEVINQYLIPLSLQLKDPAKPVDEYSINLLPKKWVRKYELKKLKLQIWSVTLLVSYFVWLIFFAALAAYLFMTQQIEIFKSSQSTLRETNPKKVQIIEDIQKNNLLANNVVKISEKTILPQTILNTIYSLRPDKISITQYVLDLDKGTIDLSGDSADRISLLMFKQALEEREEFSLVNIPIAYLEVETDFSFTMSFSYLPISANKQTQRKRK